MLPALSELKICVSLDQFLGAVVLKAHRQLAIFAFTFDFDNRAQPVLRVPHARANQWITTRLSPRNPRRRCGHVLLFPYGVRGLRYE